MNPDFSPTICAPATPAGGALGIIRVSGKDAISMTNAIFSRDIIHAKGFTMHYGQMVDNDANPSETANGENVKEKIIDDVILLISRAPHSYTGEDTVEISHHGSPYIQNAIIRLLLAQGCRMAKPGEYTQRAFINGKLDLSQAESVADLIASRTAVQHRIAMSQMRGGISSRLAHLRDELLQMTSLLELELDFSEEDVEFADRQKLLTLASKIQKEIQHLTASFSAGNAIKNGIPVAIIGAPNVGKSTLLNQLLGDDKAIVSDIQGTTRDLVEDTITLGGFLFRFIDTAGLRQTNDTIERMGIERSIKAASKARIILHLAEPGVPFSDISVNEEQIEIRIINKSEHFQAINGLGVEELKMQLITFANKMMQNDDDVIITNLRHKESLDLALTDILSASDAIQQGITGDLIAENLRQCISHLSDIVGGAITTDEVLGNIFSHFCIGK